MSGGWKFIFHEEAMKLLLGLRGVERELLLRQLERLINDPLQRPDAYRIGGEDRKYFIKYLAGYRVVYWLDGFGQEFRIVEIEKPAAAK